MKDYTIDFKEKKKFILNYEIKDDQIIIKLASGDKKIIPYNIETEKEILRRMKKQVEKSNDFKIRMEEKIAASKMFSIIFSILIIISIYAITHIPNILNVKISLILASFTAIYGFVSYAFEIIKANNIIKDIEKNKIFLKNEKFLNKNIKTNKKILENTKINDKSLTINNIDKLRLKELKQMLEELKNDKNEIKQKVYLKE